MKTWRVPHVYNECVKRDIIKGLVMSIRYSMHALSGTDKDAALEELVYKTASLQTPKNAPS